MMNSTTGVCPNCGKPVRRGHKFDTELCGVQYRNRNAWAQRKRSANVEWVTVEQIKQEDKQGELFAPVPRPADGPRCGCGNLLYAYEVPPGKCLRCSRSAMIAARESTLAARVGERG